MHRSYQPSKPTTNRVLAKKWDDSKFSSHRDRVHKAKPMVDTRPPKVHTHMAVKMKKLQLEEERSAVIDRDNRMLLEKMSHIMHTRGRIDDRNDYAHKSLNREKRQRELMGIMQENDRMVSRLKARTAKPNYDNSKMATDWERKQRYASTIARYPSDWYQQMQREGTVRQRGGAGQFSHTAPATLQTRQPLPPIRAAASRAYSADESESDSEQQASHASSRAASRRQQSAASAASAYSRDDAASARARSPGDESDDDRHEASPAPSKAAKSPAAARDTEDDSQAEPALTSPISSQEDRAASAASRASSASSKSSAASKASSRASTASKSSPKAGSRASSKSSVHSAD